MEKSIRRVHRFAADITRHANRTAASRGAGYGSVTRSSPGGHRESLDIFGAGVAILNNRGLFLAWPIPGDLFGLTGAALAAAIAAAFAVSRWARRRQARTGAPHAVFRVSLGRVTAIPALVFVFTGAKLDWDVPELKRFIFEGGVRLPTAFLALVVALTIYDVAHKAEIVKAGIQSVPKGLTEAAYSLGLRPWRTMPPVIFPLAMRAIIPPMISSSINVVKNSSLAIAIGFADVVAVFQNTALNQSGYAVEIVAMTMGFYMAMNLLLSALLNVYSKHMALRE